MKISIDTREDSPEEIRKAIRMLQSLVHDKEVYTNSGNIFEDPESMTQPSQPESEASQPSGNVFGNLFGDSQQSQQPEETEEQEKKETPEVMIYD
ncbi:hypothetical protein KY360_06480 [Candidatus Woesearchaeota archaeon]|nr:hypothetical protein [Candidatus Woesearchaeota archaeon]